VTLPEEFFELVNLTIAVLVHRKDSAQATLSKLDLHDFFNAKTAQISKLILINTLTMSIHCGFLTI